MHLAILERKPAVLGLLLADLDAALLTEVVTAQLVTLDQERILPSKREEEETQRMFTVAGKKGASISVISCMETKVDWQPTFQWNAIHLAVKHDVPCLKVLLSLLESRLSNEALSSLLRWKDSKGRCLLHLAASDSTSSSPCKLLLDCGADVNCLDSYLVSPLVAAARSGTVDTARELLEHGADACGPQLDVTGKGALDYAHSPDMVTFFLESDYFPSLDILTRQLRISPENAKAVLSTCLRYVTKLYIVHVLYI